MPISNNASYVPTINEFAAHWAVVNAALPAPLQVRAADGPTFELLNFTVLRASLLTCLNDVIGNLNDQEIARGDINLRKEAMLDALREFTQTMNAYFQNTPYLNAVPKIPSISDGEETFCAPLRDMASLWTKINLAPPPGGLPLPLILSDSTAQADFAAKLVNLTTAYATEASAGQSVAIERAKRDDCKAQAYAVMKTYRQAVPARCAQFPVLVDTLPVLTPNAGHTPDPVNASATFQAPDQSKVTYTASTDASLARYELRGNPGSRYSEDDAVVVATNAPADLLEFLTDFGLTQPGAQVALKLYVVLTTGNEAGSPAMLVQRP